MIFYGLSIFLDYLMQKPPLWKNSNGTIQVKLNRNTWNYSIN